MKWVPRIAELSDVESLKRLITESSEKLLGDLYSKDQIQKALGPVFGVDEQMIVDRTYFAVEDHGEIVGCGGWSYRKALYGGRSVNGGEAECLDASKDAARIRAFFVHPGHARRGIGSDIMQCCEEAIKDYGFVWGEISATLSGESLYKNFDYQTVENYEIPLENCQPLRVVRMIKKYDS